MAQLRYLTTTEFDFGAVAKLKDSLATLGIKRPLLCTDQGIVAAGLLDKVREVLGNDIALTIYDETPGNPTEEAVLDALEIFQQNECDGFIALGGGSSMDLAKGVGILESHDEDLGQYGITEAKGRAIGPIKPLIAIPTTSGTGSEVSVGAVVILKDGRKMTFASNTIIPSLAICDPELTLGLPKSLTAATGMDAVTHCIEAVLSPVVNPPAEAVGLDGLERAVKGGNLKRAVEDGSDRDARWHMMMASTEGAMAFVKGLGGVHAMSHACGRIKELGLHHGTLNAVILPTILRFNDGHVGNKYDRLRYAMGLAEGTDIAAAIEELNAAIGLPANLGEMGITEDMLPGLVQNAAGDAATFTNPRQTSPEDYENLFREAIG